uniref:Uncharacterized protein n=1 Tax=Arcella intermedia TaxID=1963864 RepID=A0A6B2L2S2_9EUKA
MKFQVFEKGGRPGGTWYFNQYPGCACDVASYLYSYSFEYYNWSAKFAPQPEIRDYLDGVVKKYKIEENILFNTAVNGLEWDQKLCLWKITTTSDTFYANVIINAIGALHDPSFPDIKGSERFQGYTVHSSAMKRDYSPDNKSIAVIGNAASALQLVPEIAKTAKKVYIFQRSPNWVTDKQDYKYPQIIRAMLYYVPPLAWIHRVWLYIHNEYFYLIFFNKDSKVNQFAQTRLVMMMKQILGDDDLVKKLTPDYPIGCKRVLISDKLEYYHALKKSNVTLITDPIQGISEDGVSTALQKFEVDDIIYATGFHVGKFRFTIKGKDGKIVDLDTLKTSFLGVCFPDLPNFYSLLGPNTGLGHNSIIYMIECQVEFVFKMLEFQVQKDLKSITVKKESALNWVNSLTPKFSHLVWSASCTSYYKDQKGFNYTLYPGFTFSYWGELIRAFWQKSHHFQFHKS